MMKRLPPPFPQSLPRHLSTIVLSAILLMLSIPASLVRADEANQMPKNIQHLHELTMFGIDSVVQHMTRDFDVEEEDAKALKTSALEARKEVFGLRRKAQLGMQKLSAKKFSAKLKDLDRDIDTVFAKAWPDAKKRLTDKQVARLTQLKYQQLGVDALHEEDVQEAIQLTTNQVQAIVKAQQETEQKVRKMFEQHRQDMQNQPGFSRERNFRMNNAHGLRVQEQNDALEAQIFDDILKPDQKVAVEKLTGLAFDFFPEQIRLDRPAGPAGNLRERRGLLKE